jgi:hypothetical protein
MSEYSRNHKVVLNLDGQVSPKQFVKGVRNFFGLLQSVARDVTGKEKGVKWLVSVKEGSNLIIAQGHPEKADAHAVATTINSLDEGLKALDSGVSEPPEHFDGSALDFVRDLANLAEAGKKRGLEKVEILANGSPVGMTARAVVSLNRIEGKKYKAFGSVEGRLHTVSDRGGFRVAVYDSLRDKRVECNIDKSTLDDALEAFGKRVTVHGMVTYQPNGIPERVSVDRIDVFKSHDELPPIECLRGIFKT